MICAVDNIKFSLTMKHLFKFYNEETNKINIPDMIKTLLDEEELFISNNSAYKIKKHIEVIYPILKKDFDLFYKAMIQEMLNNYVEKELSYRQMTYEESLNALSKKLENEKEDKTEKLFVDIANFCSITWMNKLKEIKE